MAKFYGAVGYAESKESGDGVWTDTITERNYFGDVIKNARQWQSGESANDNLEISNTISIVSDPYAYQNFHAIKYVEWMGARWKVKNIDVQSPRLLLTIGGVYNGE